MMEKLREALKVYDESRKKAALYGVPFLVTIVEAARRLLDARRYPWCLTHESTFSFEDGCDRGHVLELTADCRLASEPARLITEETE